MQKRSFANNKMDCDKVKLRKATTMKCNGSEPVKIHEALLRYSTKLEIFFTPVEQSEAKQIYVPAPKPSKLLLEYLNSPNPRIESKIKPENKVLLKSKSLKSNSQNSFARIGLGLCRNTLSFF